jgi:hypothetical protein
MDLKVLFYREKFIHIHSIGANLSKDRVCLSLPIVFTISESAHVFSVFFAKFSLRTKNFPGPL